MKKITVEEVKFIQSLVSIDSAVDISSLRTENEIMECDEPVKKKAIAKKTIILYVLKILQQYPSEEKPVTQSAIARYLNDINVPCDRKTVGRNIEYLKEFGIKIIKVEGKGFYIDKNHVAKFPHMYIK